MVWILATGVWDDDPGVWSDGDVWNDFPPAQPVLEPTGRGGGYLPWTSFHNVSDEEERRRIRKHIREALGLPAEEVARQLLPRDEWERERSDEIRLIAMVSLEEQQAVHQIIEYFERKERQQLQDMQDIVDLDAMIASLIEVRNAIAEEAKFSGLPQDARDVVNLDVMIEDRVDIRNLIAEEL